MANKDMEATMVDVCKWDHEKTTMQRDIEKKKMFGMIEASVIANKGNVGMIKQMLKKDAKDKGIIKALVLSSGFP